MLLSSPNSLPPLHIMQERFHAAARFMGLVGQKGPPELQLLLFALGQQATEGTCKTAGPRGWDLVENAKHQVGGYVGAWVNTWAAGEHEGSMRSRSARLARPPRCGNKMNADAAALQS